MLYQPLLDEAQNAAHALLVRGVQRRAEAGAGEGFTSLDSDSRCSTRSSSISGPDRSPGSAFAGAPALPSWSFPNDQAAPGTLQQAADLVHLGLRKPGLILPESHHNRMNAIAAAGVILVPDMRHIRAHQHTIAIVERECCRPRCGSPRSSVPG